MSPDQRALVAVSEPPIYSRLEALLESAGMEIGRALDQETALALGFRQSFALVVSDLPLRGANLRDFVFNLTGSGSLSPGAPVVLYGGSLGGAPLLDDGGRVSHCNTPTGLLRRVARHLGLGDRVTRRLRVKMVASVPVAARRALETQNLSPSGMLLRTPELLPVGSVFPVAIELPSDGEPLAGRVEVVRHTDPGIEGVVGMGVRFVELGADGDRRLARFVASARP